MDKIKDNINNNSPISDMMSKTQIYGVMYHLKKVLKKI